MGDIADAILKKPKREDYGWWTPDTFAMAERDYYKAVAEFAVEKMRTSYALILSGITPLITIREALEAIKQTGELPTEESEPPCVECGQRDCNGECIGHGLMGG